MPYNKINNTDKARLIAAYNKGDDIYKLAQQLGIKNCTARAIIVRDINRDGQPARPHGGKRNTKIDGEMKDVISDLV